MSWKSARLSRRAFVSSSLGAAPMLLAACTQGPPTSPTSTTPAQASPSSSAVFPTYQAAANRPTPDFPSAGSLYEDGYNNYPTNPLPSVSRTPGLGGSLTAFVQPLQAPPTPLDQNPAWQEVNRQLGAQFNFNMVPVADYRAKLTTLMAGSDLPDLINVFRGINRQSSTVSECAVRGPEPVSRRRCQQRLPESRRHTDIRLAKFRLGYQRPHLHDSGGALRAGHVNAEKRQHL
jgi:putative aldouronate transport system substrate-binding protein